MNNNHQQEQQQNMPTGAGLTRYRSAPSSYFTNILNSPTHEGGFGSEDFVQLFNLRASSPETQRIFSRFMNSTATESVTVQENCSENMILAQQPQPQQFVAQLKKEPDQVLQRQQSNDYSSASRRICQGNSDENKVWGAFNADGVRNAKTVGGGGANSELIRHSSSPAGQFANINIEAEFGGMRGIRSYGGGNSNLDFSSKQYSSSGMMDTLSEIESKGMGENSLADRRFEVDRANDDNYSAEFIHSWDDQQLLSDNFLGELAADTSDSKRFLNVNPSNDKDNGGRNRPRTMLAHHLSLPKTSSDFSVEKLLQDSVPCKIRAKRGCATHPRSIAERVRRTKISDRIRKLQELVPSMEKQTNTSDMLELAVDYIKELQRQVKTLSECKERCTCSAKEI